MVKKIAFIGTHGTGKTTLTHKLIYKLKEIGINVDYCEEVSRRCPLPINETAKTETQRWILGKQITEESEKSIHCDLLVCDRSVLDTYSYQTALIGKEKPWEPFIKDYLKTYELLIRVPLVEKNGLEDDNFRSLDPEFQKRVDEEITKNMNLFKPNYIEFKDEKTMGYLYKKYSK